VRRSNRRQQCGIATDATSRKRQKKKLRIVKKMVPDKLLSDSISIAIG